MLKNNCLLPILFATHVLSISAFDLKAAQQSNAVHNADDRTSSSTQITGNLSPSGRIVTVIENVTVTTCPEHNATPTSITLSPTPSNTPCNILASSASLIPTTNAAQPDTTTVYTTTSFSTSSYICVTGWATSTYTFATNKTRRRIARMNLLRRLIYLL